MMVLLFYFLLLQMRKLSNFGGQEEDFGRSNELNERKLEKV